MRKFKVDYNDDTPSKHANYGKRWLPQELSALSECVDRGLTLRTICQLLGRPPSGVMAKLVRTNIIREVAGEWYVSSPIGNEPYANNPAINGLNVTFIDEKSMTTLPSLQTKHLLNGTDVANMTKDELIREYVKLRTHWLNLNTLNIMKRGGVLEAHNTKVEADLKFIENLIESR